MTTHLDLAAVALEGEHAAVHGYGVLGSRLSGAALALARNGVEGHRARRDQLAALLRSAGRQPPAPHHDYAVTAPGAADAVDLAVRLEDGMAVRWRDLVGVARDRELRSVALAGLQECAVRAAQWRQVRGDLVPTRAFPGDPVPAPPVPRSTFPPSP